MLKNILKLDGAQKLSKNEQKSINGGKIMACAECWHPDRSWVCVDCSSLLPIK